MDTNFGDTFTPRMRLGNYRPFKLKVARGLIWSAFFTMFLMFLAIQMYNLQTKNLEYRIALRDTIYQNLKHK